MIQGDPRYDPDARKKKIADLKVKQTFKQYASLACSAAVFCGRTSAVQIEAAFKRESRGKLSQWSNTTECWGVTTPPSQSPLLTLTPPTSTAT